MISALTCNAWAQSAPTAPTEEVEAEMRRGIALRQAGDDDGALAAFRRAFQLQPSAHSQAQIALAEQALGQWLAAERDLREALAATSDPWVARNQEALQGALRQIESRLGWIEVRATPAGATLTINQQSMGALPLAQPARVAAGTVTLEVSAEGYVTQRRSIEVSGGARMREVFELVRQGQSSENNGGQGASGARDPNGGGARDPNGGAVTLPSTAAGPSLVGPIVVGAVGVAAVGVGALFGGLAQGAQGACDVHPTMPNARLCYTTESLMRAQAGVGYTTAANVLLIGGGLVAIGGAVWLGVSVAQSRRAERQARGVMVVPVASEQSVGASVLGRF